MGIVNPRGLNADELRAQLVAVVLEWESRYGVAPSATSALSEYDAARIVGHTPESLAIDCVGRTAVTRGTDFCYQGLRYQIKANRPSGKPGSYVTLVAKASNYDWDRLIWLLYDRGFNVQEAWEWRVEDYRAQFHNIGRISPSHMRSGRALHAPTHPTRA